MIKIRDVRDSGWSFGCTVFLAAGILIAEQASARAAVQFTYEYGIEFSTIQQAGNRATIPSEVPFAPNRTVGAVDHAYRISKTAVTTSQYFEFVEAYGQHTNATGSGFTSPYIFERGFVGSRDFAIREGAENYPIEANWQFLARYVNWLHNDKASGQEAFETGVYDASTFDGPIESWDITPNTGARFWIPTRDEWIKGFYYSPERYGAGVDGYWLFPDQGNEPLIPGVPGVGESSVELAGGTIFDAGSYPDSQSYYGLLDGSGGVREFTTAVLGDELNVLMAGTATGQVLSDLFDRIDLGHGQVVTPAIGSAFGGLRIAATVPAPSVFVLPAGVWLCFCNRRFR